jgi:hypothetical protein
MMLAKLKCSGLMQATLVALLSLSLLACGGQPATPPAPAAAPPAPPAAAPAEAAAPAPAPAKAAAAAVDPNAPATVHALALMPASAHAAVAYPPIKGLVERIIAVAKRIVPADEVDREVARIVDEIAMGAEVYDAKSLDDVAAAKGLDINAPVAVFGDFSPFFESVQVEIKAAGDAATPEEIQQRVEAGSKPPLWAAVLGVADKAKVESALQDDLVARIPELYGEDEKKEEIGGATVVSYGDYAYFITDKQVVLGNTALVKAAAERLNAPATFVYGTPACPAYAKDEIVALVYGKRIFETAKGILPEIAKGQQYAAALQAQLMTFEKIFDNAPDEPMVITLTAEDNDLQLAIRQDTAQQPGWVEAIGTAKPFRLAQLLPEHTKAFISYRFTDEFKKMFKENIQPAIMESMKANPEAAQAASYVNTAMDILGDELTIGITGVKDDFPEAYVMVALNNPEMSKGLFQMLIPSMPVETYKGPEGSTAAAASAESEAGSPSDIGSEGVDIFGIAAPIPIPLSIAYPGNVVLVSNNVDGMKAIIDLMRAKKSSNLFSTLDPKIPSDTPMYAGALVNTQLLEDIKPVLALAGRDASQAQPILDRITENVREVRLFSEMQGTWAHAILHAYLKPKAE